MSRKRKLPDGMVTRPGRRGYYADFRIGGHRVQKKLGTDFEAARSILNELKARAEKAEFGLLDNDYSLASLRDAFLKCCEQERRPGTVERYRYGLQSTLGWLAVHKVSQIDIGRVLDYREHRLQQGRSPGTINAETTILGTMLSWGVKKKLIGSNPIQSLEPLRHDHPKEGRALSDDEVAQLLAKSHQPWRDIWYAFLVTGMREDELAQLLLSDIDPVNRELIIRAAHAKSRRERRIPIDDGLWAILQRQTAQAPHRLPGTASNPRIAALVRQRFTQEHIFVTTQNTPLTASPGIYRAFMRCCTRAGIQVKTYDRDGRLTEHVDLHSLRRTFATNALINGADPKSVQEILGHRTLEMTMNIYAKIKGASKRQAVGKLSYGQGANPPEHLLPLRVAQG